MKMTKARLFNNLVALPLAAGLVMTAGAASALARVKIVSHRAVYDLVLKSARERSGIRDVRGRMVVELEGNACDGWSVGFRLVNDYQLPRGKFRMIDTRSTSWESGDGLNMRYVEREFIDNRPGDVTRVSVTRRDIDADGVIKLKKPKHETLKIPAGALFPVAHQIRLIREASEGVKRDKSIVYDGSDRDNIYQAITFIGKKHQKLRPGGHAIDGNGQKLVRKVAYWPVSISYYPAGETAGEGPPSHQVSFDMYENGVAGDLVLDYGDFALKGSLKRIDALSGSGDCNK